MKSRLVLIMLTVVSSNAFAFSGFAPGEGLRNEDLVALRPELAAVVGKLPKSLLEVISSTVSIGIISEKRAGSLSALCLPDGTVSYGHSESVLGATIKNGSSIVLHPDLVRPHLSRTNCTRTQLSSLLQRTLIHEMAHVFDRTDKAVSRDCQRSEAETYSCLRNLRVSDDAQFLLAAGFRPQLRNGEISAKRLNVFFDRSPRSYEGVNPQEYFAVNFEYFILDPQYKCRRPATAEFYQKTFGFDPYPQVNCGRILKVLSPSGEIVKLDLDKIYQVQFLHAANLQRLQSMWGHSMLRLVICAPEHSLGPQCLDDIRHHLIVDFTAMIGGGKTSLIGGITGQYPTGINFKKLTQVEADTVIKHDRNITTAPIQFTRQELEFFVKEIAEKYWGQVSRYKFMANNCATQTLYAVLSSVNRSAVVDHEKTLSIFDGLIATPKWVGNYFRTVGLLPKVDSALEARFRSPSATIEQLGSVMLGRKLQDIVLLSMQDRAHLYRQIKSNPAVGETVKVQLNELFFEIEQVVSTGIDKKKSLVMQVIQERIVSSNAVGKLPNSPRIGAVNSEWDGYGIPQNLESVREQLLANRLESMAKYKTILTAFTTPQEAAAIQQIETEKKHQQELIIEILSGNI